MSSSDTSAPAGGINIAALKIGTTDDLLCTLQAYTTKFGLACGIARAPVFGNAKTGKAPDIGLWKKFQTDPPGYRDYQRWAHESPGANVGLITGNNSGVVVFDEDTADKLEPKLRMILDNTPTLRAQSGRNGGGRHYYFVRPRHGKYKLLGEVKSKAVPGGEFKADGSWIILPPSVHYTGRQYRWENAEAPIAPLPEALYPFFGIDPPGFSLASIPSRLYEPSPLELYENGYPHDLTRHPIASVYIAAVIAQVRSTDAAFERVAWPFVKRWNAASDHPDGPLEGIEIRSIFEWTARQQLANHPAEGDDA
jgi:hypothetical protein